MKAMRAKNGCFCGQEVKIDQVIDTRSYEQFTSSSFGIPKTSACIKLQLRFVLREERGNDERQLESENLFHHAGACGT